MIRQFALTALTLVAPTMAAVPPEVAQDLYHRVTPSLVAVQYVFENELGRHEFTGAGLIVSDEGLVMASMSMFPVQLPDDQMKDFKILVPRENDEPQELEAIFQGRDERTETAFLKTKEPQKWKAIHFEEVQVKIGDTVLSVGMLPKSANYKTYFTESTVSATLRGEVPQVLVTGGGLAAMGAPVFNLEGKAIGMVSPYAQSPLLNDPRQQEMLAVITPPKLYIPTRQFALSLEDPPSPEHPVHLPWLGVSSLKGVTKDLAELMGLGSQPAIQVGDVIHDAPAEKAGLKSGDIIVKLNGQSIERGDEPAELPMIFTRTLGRMKSGSTLTLSVLRDSGQPLQDIQVTLGKQPKRANEAKHWYADDLGFAVRELVFADKYSMHLQNDQPGVMVSLLRPQAAAQTGGLHMSDVITKLDNEPVTDLDQFEKTYKQIRKEKPREAIVMEVHRGDRDDTVRIEPPR